MHEKKKGDNIVNVLFLKSSWSRNPNAIENNTFVICLGSIRTSRNKENFVMKMFFQIYKGLNKVLKICKNRAYCVRYPHTMCFSNLVLYFFTPKNFYYSYRLGEIHLRFALNLLKYALFWSHQAHTLSF